MDLSAWIGLGMFAVGYLSTSYICIEVMHLTTWRTTAAGMIGGTTLGLTAKYAASCLL